jgi:hypothetical protein
VARLAGAVACALPALGQACACGCGVFDVATAAMFPTRPGAMAFLEQDFMDQNTNWSGRSSARAADNADKRIRTGFWTAGLQYMINRAWTAELDVPYWQRRFVTMAADGGSVAFMHGRCIATRAAINSWRAHCSESTSACASDGERTCQQRDSRRAGAPGGRRGSA